MSDIRPSVVVDGFNLAMPKGTGVASYARTLTQCLKNMGCETGILYGLEMSRHASGNLSEVEFFNSLDGTKPRRKSPVLSPRWCAETWEMFKVQTGQSVPVTGAVEPRGVADRLPAFDQIWNARGLYRKAARYFRATGKFMSVRLPAPPQIMHWTYPLPIKLEGAKNVYTIHDLVPLRLPYTTLDDKAYHHRLLKKLVAQADALCTVSESSKADIISFFPEAAGRTHNTYQSFHQDGEASEEAAELAARKVKALFGLKKEGYYLFFGSLEPKKNLGRLLESFLMADVTVPLVIVGAMAWKSDAELRFIERGVEAGKVIKLDYLSRDLLTALTRTAKGLLFPSICEGFGLPVLEALAVDTPVLTSGEGALKEVAGDAAVFVDPYDTASIAAGIEKLDRDETIRADIRRMAPMQVRKYDLRSYEERLRAMYSACLR